MSAEQSATREETRSWYVAVATDDIWRLSWSELEEALRSQVIDGFTFVWKEGMPDWSPLKDVLKTSEFDEAEPTQVMAVKDLRDIARGPVSANERRGFGDFEGSAQPGFADEGEEPSSVTELGLGFSPVHDARLGPAGEGGISSGLRSAPKNTVDPPLKHFTRLVRPGLGALLSNAKRTQKLRQFLPKGAGRASAAQLPQTTQPPAVVKSPTVDAPEFGASQPNAAALTAPAVPIESNAPVTAVQVEAELPPQPGTPEPSAVAVTSPATAPLFGDLALLNKTRTVLPPPLPPESHTLASDAPMSLPVGGLIGALGRASAPAPMPARASVPAPASVSALASAAPQSFGAAASIAPASQPLSAAAGASTSLAPQTLSQPAPAPRRHRSHNERWLLAIPVIAGLAVAFDVNGTLHRLFRSEPPPNPGVSAQEAPKPAKRSRKAASNDVAKPAPVASVPAPSATPNAAMVQGGYEPRTSVPKPAAIAPKPAAPLAGVTATNAPKARRPKPAAEGEMGLTGEVMDEMASEGKPETGQATRGKDATLTSTARGNRDTARAPAGAGSGTASPAGSTSGKNASSPSKSDDEGSRNTVDTESKAPAPKSPPRGRNDEFDPLNPEF